MKPRSLYIIPVLLLLSCGGKHGPDSGELNTVEKEAKEMLDDYYSAIKKDGLTAEFRYLDSSKDFYWVPPGYREAISYDSVAAAIRKNAQSLRSVDNTFESLKITALSKRIATYTGRLRSVMTDTSGMSSTYLMVETGTLIKRADGWKLLSGQTTILDK